MTLQELWQAQYQAKRYLQHLSDEELAQRFNDILGNLTTLVEDGTIGCLRPTDADGRYWWIACSHALEEWFLRGQTLERLGTLARTAQVPRSTWPHAPRALKAIKGRGTKTTDFLVKYGKERYLREALTKGIIRISPASSYSDPSLNPALKDNELEITLSALGSDVTLEIPEHPGGPPAHRLPVLDNVSFQFGSKTDYYVYCLSMVLDHRLFDDFHADACLIISEPQAFIEKLDSAFEQAMPGWSGISWPVQYLDPFLTALPLRTPDGHVDVYLCKHFRYAYQKEFRFVWLPDEPQDALQLALQPVCVEVGSLAECCELIVL